MKRALNLLICLISLTLMACHSNKSSNSPNARTQNKSEGVCQPESELLAAGIVNGDMVKKGDMDDKAVVMLYGDRGLCTAAVIGEQLLLTASHCISEKSEKLLAIFYPSLSCESGFDVTKYSLKVSRVAKHPGYDESLPVEQRKDDIALVFLKDKVPTDYPVYKIADPRLLNGSDNMYLYGYGLVGEKKGGRGILRKAVVGADRYRIMDESKKVSVNQQDSGGFCMGDSGGPGLVILNDELYILGINSYVNGIKGDICNGLGFQTLAYSYLDWIEDEKNKFR